MKQLMKRHSSFLAWVLMPSLLLIASVLGVNLVSKPSLSFLNSSCGSGLPDSNCTSLTNPCVQETCSLLSPTAPTGFCEPANTPPFTVGGVGSVCGCNVCGNGRCEVSAGETATTCPEDCAPPGVLGKFNGCDAATLPSTVADGCCPNIADTTDPDCCSQCGDGIVGPTEQCEPSIPGCAQGEVCVNCQCQAIPTACPTNPSIPLAQIQCIPDANTVGCDTNCQCQVVSEGSGCGGKQDESRFVNAACAPLIAGASGGSVVPPSLFSSLNPSLLSGILTLFGVPGGVYAASRWRKRRR